MEAMDFLDQDLAGLEPEGMDPECLPENLVIRVERSILAEALERGLIQIMPKMVKGYLGQTPAAAQA